MGGTGLNGRNALGFFQGREEVEVAALHGLNNLLIVDITGKGQVGWWIRDGSPNSRRHQVQVRIAKPDEADMGQALSQLHKI